MTALRTTLRRAAARLADAGIESADRDAALLLAHVLGCELGEVRRREVLGRTYNFPENRIADHRTGYKSYNLDAVLDGDLDAVVQSALDADEAARLAAVGESGA